MPSTEFQYFDVVFCVKSLTERGNPLAMEDLILAANNNKKAPFWVILWNNVLIDFFFFFYKVGAMWKENTDC